MAVGKAPADDEAVVPHAACEPREDALVRCEESLTENTDLSAVGMAAENEGDVVPFEIAGIILRVVAQQNTVRGC